MSWILLLLGCTSGSQVVDTAPVEDTASSTPDWSQLAPTWTEEDVRTEVEAALEYGLPRPEVICENLLDLLAYGDGDCPGHDDQISNTVWGLEGCTADSGYTYKGLLVYEEFLDWDDPFEFLLQSITIGDFQIIHHTGEIVLGGGNVDYERQLEAGQSSNQQARSLIRGMWRDPLHTEPWLAAGISAYLSMLLESEPDGGVMMQLEGSLGIDEYYLYFDQLEFLSSDCGGTPRSGGIWIRQPDSSWYQLTYDGSCGCPALTWNHTEVIGEACVDTSSLYDHLLLSLGATF